MSTKTALNKELATVSVADEAKHANTGWNPELVAQLSISVMAFAVVLLIAATVLMARNKASSGEIVRLFGLVLIVTLSTVLVIVGYSNEQLAPIVGLFGAIAGYLLGKDPAPKTAGRRSEGTQT